MVSQTITLFQVLELVGIILAIVFTGMGISKQIKKNYNEYVDNKMNVVDMRITAIEKEVEDYQKQNEREHDRLTVLFDRIDSKLDDLIKRIPYKK